MSEYRNIFTDRNGIMYLGPKRWRGAVEADEGVGKDKAILETSRQDSPYMYREGVIELL